MVSVGSVDGLISGMNTSQVIAQLMQIEAQPQTNLKNEVAQENLVISAYQAVNTKMLALQSAAEAFTAPNALTPTNPTWQAVTASSSSTSVTATAATGATPGSLTFDVTALAQAQVTTANVTATGPVTTGNGIAITIGGKTTQVNVTTDTAQGVADAINAARTGVAAAVVTTSTGSTVLQFTGTSTGAANAFTISGLSAATTDIAAASDAQITVGNPSAGGYTVTSATNTFANLLKNVTVNVSKVETGVTVTLASDQNSIADKMQALVDAANAALGQIGTSSAYDPNNKTAGPLTGDYTVRELRDNILSAVSNGLSGYGSYSQFGVALDSTGKLTFDRNKFLTAYAANPAAVQNAVAGGLAKSLDGVATSASDSVTGNLTLAIQSGNSQVSDLNRRISDWDTRLALQQQMLKTQFANMETALGSMKDQSAWLAGQIAGLPATG